MADTPTEIAMATGTASQTGDAKPPETLYDAPAVLELIAKLAGQIESDMDGRDGVCLIGIQRRGDTLARRFCGLIQEQLGREIPSGSLDITLYRDDFDSLAPQPVVGKTALPFTVVDKTIYLVDDVLYTGRTIRAALDELSALGRPARILLAVLIDRGGRELPIEASFVGKHVEAEHREIIDVKVQEEDDTAKVLLLEKVGE
jgi:pyrimidine operon attenuation protein/uracil phosphoribosyltransferase